MINLADVPQTIANPRLTTEALPVSCQSGEKKEGEERTGVVDGGIQLRKS